MRRFEVLTILIILCLTNLIFFMEYAYLTYIEQFSESFTNSNLEKLIVTIKKPILRWGRSEARHRNGLQIK